MKKILPEYTRSEVNKAGKILIKTDDIDLNEWLWAFDVMNNWRACHDYPINTFQANLRTKIKKRGYKSAIVVQRLKRVPSIISKLSRNPSMNLSRMQDLGGLRAIVSTVKQIDTIKNDFVASKFQHELVREYDYIVNPKESGYRGVHLVYKYHNSRVTEYDGFLIEVQIRSKIQHAWATAVETMGTFLDSSLKSSEGPDEWLDFFALCGSGFALLEKCPTACEHIFMPDHEIISKLKTQEEELNVIEALRAYGATMKALDERNINYKYFILILRLKEHKVEFEGYHSTQLDIATKRYTDYEKNLGKQSDTQVVLVSGDSFKSLKRAYPNYFLDTEEFLKQLYRLFEKNG